MRAPTHLQSGTLGFNMTPMIDIVFLLIIFFIVSSHLAQQETQLELDLPSAQSGHEPQADHTRRIVVNVLPEGEVLLAGVPVAPGELASKIHFERQQHGADLEIRIRSDRSVPYEVVEPILVACARSGVWKVTFAVVPRDG